MTLVYCNYPILDQQDEPDWVGLLRYVQTQGSLQGVYFYRPFMSLEHQGLEEVLSVRNPERDAQLLQLAKIIRLDHILTGYTVRQSHPYPEYSDIVAEERRSNMHSHIPVLKDLWVLSRADIVVTDCNTPDHGTKDMVALLARMLGIPSVSLTDRFLVGPWLHTTSDFTVKTLQLADLLEMLAKRIESQPQPENTSEETNKGQTDGVQLQDS